MLTTSCSHLPSLSLPISLLSKDLLSTRECFSLDFGKFSTICLFICSVCYCFSNCVGLVFWRENGRTDVQILGFSASLITPVVFLGRIWTY